MMGVRDGQQPLFSYNVNLAERVHKNHPLRKVDELIDFSFVRSKVEHTYGECGHKSEDPEVILKLMFLLFFDNVDSERELMRQLPYRLDYLWFLRLQLDDDVPDHSVLSKARARWGAEVFETLFVHTVAQCVDAGLVDGGKLHFDGSIIDANASNDSVVKGPPELIAALRSTYAREELKLDELELVKDGDDNDPGSKAGGGQVGQESPRKKPGGYQKKNDSLMSTTDPDAAIVSKRHLGPRPRYKNHRAVDDQCGVITAVQTTSGDVEENARLMDLIEASEQNTGAKVEVAVADAQYGTADNFRQCGERGIKSHMADLAATHKNKGRKRGIFAESDFSYDGESDTYTCPAGQTLTRRRHKKRRQAYEYTAGPKVCNACEIKALCTRSQYGRSVKRHEGHELIEEARAQSASPEAKRDRVRRKHVAEGSFADASNNHGFKRSRWRGRWRQELQDWLIASIQNVRILIARNPGPASKSSAKALAGGKAFNLAAKRFLRLPFGRMSEVFC